MHQRILFGILFALITTPFLQAEKLVDFRKDVQPILKLRCLECHGPDEAKNDFRVDDEETMFYYIEAGDIENSSLWNDYLITDDPSLKMPPPNSPHGKGLTGPELATIKTWIEEGADFDWETVEVEVDPEKVDAADSVAEMSTPEKVWIFQGLFHPAMTHFPVGLLSISVIFLVLSRYGGPSFESAAFHCLWVGALGACGACLSGWAYAVHEGYGLNFSLANNIDRHRWLGVVVAVGSLLLVPIAYSAVKSETGKEKKILAWFIGSCLVALCVSIVGYQGGELVYGEGHYEKEFNELFLNDKAEVQPEIVEESIEEVAETEPAE